MGLVAGGERPQENANKVLAVSFAVTKELKCSMFTQRDVVAQKRRQQCKQSCTCHAINTTHSAVPCSHCYQLF